MLRARAVRRRRIRRPASGAGRPRRGRRCPSILDNHARSPLPGQHVRGPPVRPCTGLHPRTGTCPRTPVRRGTQAALRSRGGPRTAAHPGYLSTRPGRARRDTAACLAPRAKGRGRRRCPGTPSREHSRTRRAHRACRRRPALGRRPHRRARRTHRSHRTRPEYRPGPGSRSPPDNHHTSPNDPSRGRLTRLSVARVPCPRHRVVPVRTSTHGNRYPLRGSPAHRCRACRCHHHRRPSRHHQCRSRRHPYRSRRRGRSRRHRCPRRHRRGRSRRHRPGVPHRRPPRAPHRPASRHHPSPWRPGPRPPWPRPPCSRRSSVPTRH